MRESRKKNIKENKNIVKFDIADLFATSKSFYLF